YASWARRRTALPAPVGPLDTGRATGGGAEPLYAFYLDKTGISHPGRDEILASMPSDWRVVLDYLTAAPLPPGKSVFYGKHMTHPLLPEVDPAALAPLRHAHPIPGPARPPASD